MKNTWKSAAVAATVMLGLAGASHADQTLTGAVGLPLNPTAQIPEPGGIRLQGSYFDFGRPFDGADKVKFYGLHAAGRVGSRVEVSGGISHNSAGDLEDFSDDFGKTGIDLGVKYLITRESDPAGVRLAVGAGYSRALLNNVNAYFVASKYLGSLSGGRFPITGHLGVRYDRFRVEGDGGDDAKSTKASIYGGVEVPLTRRGDFTLVGELQSKNVDNNLLDNSKIPYSASVRYRPRGQGFSASIGIARQGLTGDNGVFAQLGYTFGSHAASDAANTATAPAPTQ